MQNVISPLRVGLFSSPLALCIFLYQNLKEYIKGTTD